MVLPRDQRRGATASARGEADGGEDGLRVETGHSSRANVVRNPLVVLMFPPSQPDGMSLIVDGEGEVNGDGVVVRPTWAVLHRSAV